MLLLDGDVIACKAGYAAEERVYEVIDHDTLSFYGGFKLKVDACAFAASFDSDNIEIVLRRFDKGLDMATSNVDMILESIRTKYPELPMKVIIGGKTNFRKEIYPEYKANRDPKKKPLQLKALERYLMEVVPEYEVTSGEEADDRLGVLAGQLKGSVICSIDKDMLMIPGKHYNITDKVELNVKDPGTLYLYKTSNKWNLKGTGFKWFCAQMCLGDGIDNIPGLWQIGAKKTYDYLHTTGSCRECWDKVKELYVKKEREDIMTIAKLLWIRRKEGELFDEFLIPST